MRINIQITCHSLRIDKVLETDNGEILHREFPTGALRHDVWFQELEPELKSQILTQVRNPEFLAGLAA